jgi:hypothetical protein
LRRPVRRGSLAGRAGQFTELWPTLRHLGELSRREVADAVGIAPTTVTSWSHHRPDIDRIEPLAALLSDRLRWHPAFARISVADLAEALERSRSPEPDPHEPR